MAATDRSEPDVDADAVSAACRDADFVCVLAGADGDALAAAGLLAGAMDAIGTPYQVRIVRTRAAIDDAIASIEAATPVVLGADVPGVPSVDAPVLSVHAYEAAASLGGAPDPACALAGVRAAGATPGQVGASILETAGLEQRDGLAIPTRDPADLAYSTLVHGPFSGDPAAAHEALADADAVFGSEVASLCALSVVGHDDATERAASAVARGLRPYVGGPLETIGGYADVLSALASSAPGLGIALVLDRADAGAAISAWREHGRAVHAGVRGADIERYAGVLVARVDGPVGPVARLLRDYRSPEPTVLAVGAGDAAIAGTDPVSDAVESALERIDGSALVRDRLGYLTFDTDRDEALVEAVREVR